MSTSNQMIKGKMQKWHILEHCSPKHILKKIKLEKL